MTCGSCCSGCAWSCIAPTMGLPDDAVAPLLKVIFTGELILETSATITTCARPTTVEPGR